MNKKYWRCILQQGQGVRTYGESTKIVYTPRIDDHYPDADLLEDTVNRRFQRLNEIRYEFRGYVAVALNEDQIDKLITNPGILFFD